MHHVRGKLGILTVLLMSTIGSTCPAQREAGRAPKRPSSDREIRVPFDYAGLIYVDVRVNGSPPLRFILDTGSSWTFLDSGVARSLSIETGRRRSAWAAGDQPLQMAFARDLRLGMGETELLVPEVAVTDFRGQPFVGIIGSDLLQRYVVDLDYAGGELTLYDPDRFQYDGKGIVIPFTLQERLPLLRLEVVTPTRAAVEARCWIPVPRGR